MDEPGMVANPARGKITRESGVLPVPVRAKRNGLARQGCPSCSASARSSSTLRLNTVLTHGIHATFREGVHIYRQPSLG